MRKLLGLILFFAGIIISFIYKRFIWYETCSGGTYSTELQDRIMNLHEIDESVITDLEALVEDVNKLHKVVMVSKTAGVATSTVGTVLGIAGVALAPFTAGLSYGLTIAGGILVGTGATINIGTIIGDAIKSRNYLEKIRTLTEKHDEESRKFSSVVEEIRDIVRILKDDYHIDENTAIIAILGIDIARVGEQIEAGFAARKAVKIANAVAALKSTNSVLSNSLFPSGLSFKIGKSLTELTSNELTGIIHIIKTPAVVAKASGNVGKAIFKAVTSTLGAAFTLYEIHSLVQEWKTKHPTIETISTLIKNLKSEKAALKLLLKSFCH